LLRGARLGLIWTGASEIIDLIIQHEVYRELGAAALGRDVEADAEGSGREERRRRCACEPGIDCCPISPAGRLRGASGA